MSIPALAALGKAKRDIISRIRTDEAQKAFVFLAGVSDGAVVEDWLQIQSNRDALRVLLNDSTRLTSLFSYTVRGSAIVSSDTALDILVGNLRTVTGNDATMSAIGNSNIVAGKFLAGAAGLDPTAYADMDAVLASQEAMEAVLASQLATEIVVASQLAMDVLDSSDPINIPVLTGPDPRARASSTYSSSYDPWRAFNGDILTGWSAGTSGTSNEWISWDFGTPVWCYRAAYQPPDIHSVFQRIPKEAVFECADSINGPWEVAATVSPDVATKASQTFVMQNAVGKKRYWRMRNTVQDGYYFTVGKLQFWGIK